MPGHNDKTTSELRQTRTKIGLLMNLERERKGKKGKGPATCRYPHVPLSPHCSYPSILLIINYLTFYSTKLGNDIIGGEKLRIYFHFRQVSEAMSTVPKAPHKFYAIDNCSTMGEQ